MRAIDVLHMGTPSVICCWQADGVLVDPGPESCVETLLTALDGERPSALLLTHIHFDHAGAAGALVRRWPDLEVYVHERGAPHMASPERLVASAARLYGGPEALARLWGEVVPVPEENLRVLRGGETILDGRFRVAYTPGHATHHVSYFDESSRWAFVGDVAGVRIAPADYVVAPTPPPDIDVPAWEGSIDVLDEWAPEALALTHFGAVEDVESHLLRLRERLHEQVLLVQRHGQEAFIAGMTDRVTDHAGDLAPAYLQAAPPDHLWLGLDRWRRKREEAAAAAD
jgi:glyoxylase-like metal-dependent hydrolase (beta-lactamase superfamily II)